jgi:hypothetical protein
MITRPATQPAKALLIRGRCSCKIRTEQKKGAIVSLFVAKHRHSAEACPAQDPEMGAMLLEHLSDESAARQGISIHGEAVIEGQHTLYLIADAPDRAALEAFLAPFAMAGSVEVLEANPCAAVVDRASC